ncbi:MAG: hypothetical protein GWN58_68185 [Anaerolineae bacterium]|nr:hypothetical protein [Anaerolineae bacterium]
MFSGAEIEGGLITVSLGIELFGVLGELAQLRLAEDLAIAFAGIESDALSVQFAAGELELGGVIDHLVDL